MAVVAFLLTFSIVYDAALNCIVLGPKAYLKGEEVSFYNTDGFINRFHQDFYSCKNLSCANSEEFVKQANKYKEQVCEPIINNILDYKASIIKAELEYAVNNWDDTYYLYEGTEEVTLPSNYSTEVYVNVEDPEQIKTAQKILVNAKGQEFLLFESLVREDAFLNDYGFTENLYSVNKEMNMDSAFSGTVSLAYSEKEIRNSISAQYDAFVETEAENRYGVSLAQERLENVKNLKYYIVDLDGNVYKNIDSIPKNLTNRDNYILVNKENRKYKGFEYLEPDEVFEGSNVNVLCIYFDEEFKEDDIYSSMYATYKMAKDSSVKKYAVELLIALILLVLFLVIYFKILGKRPDESIKTIWIDKIPLDLFLACVILLGFGASVCFHDVASFGTEFFDRFIFTQDCKILCIILLFVLFVLFTVWLSSVVKVAKSGQNVLKKTLIYMVLNKLFCFMRSLFYKIKNVLSYKPKVFRKRVIAFGVLYFIINAVLSFMLLFCYNVDEFALFFVGITVILNGVIMYFVLRYVNTLDKIIAASENHENAEISEKSPASLIKLSKNLEDSNESLKVAVAQAVKNEQMKTQLITNVSHDLKTPLTSIINYSDLLHKCNVEDEKANEYIDVINNQSNKLKRLIEDLIEASKVSTGNVQLNKVYLNLSELAVQTIVEYSPDFEVNKNEVKFTEPESAPVIFADGLKTNRIISNLFSNAKKYSAYGTRIYVSVYEDEKYGYFEIKNVSKEPLNISPEMLTERFVRGEESRTNEGNGLGLSIAKDLCTLQGGELIISIDGDLFKATVKLKKEE